jgi:hypothetical protein
MRVFLAACLAIALIALGAALILNGAAQQSAATAFASSSVRL